MKLNTYEDDPRVTAYVLGELDATEIEAFEQEMQRDPELKELVQEFRAGTQILEEVVSSETASDVSLDSERRKFLDEAIRAEQRRGSKVGWWKNPWQMTSMSFAAACLLIGVGFYVFQNNTVIERAVTRQDISSISKIAGSKDEIVVSTEIVEEELRGEMRTKEVLPPLLNEAADGETMLSLNESKKVVLTDNIVPIPPAVTLPKRKPLKTSIPPELIEGTPLPVRLRDSLDRQAGSTVAANQQARQVRLYALPESGAQNFKRKSVTSRGVESLRRNYESFWSDTSIKAESGNEGYAEIVEKGFTRIVDAETGTSTFSADVDTASYANIRRFLNSGQLPPADAVRIEEMVNYFIYDYAEPEGKHPFTADVEIADCPWQPKHRLARIGIKAESVDADERKPMNLVFLIDVSGSMNSQNKLPLLKRAMKLMVKNLNEDDRVAIVTYAGSSGLVLESTPVKDRHQILSVLDRLQSGGSTAGAVGIQLAYQVARENLINNGQNRVILCTDGDFNVGVTDNEDLTELIRRGGKDGVFLNIFGFGMGNIKDDRLEQLSNDGNGTYGYIDSFQEAQKVFSEQLQGTLATVAKDVKFQLEFNPSQVAAYRLIGYENRMLAREDFNDDTKDAGEVGAGHAVTALYEMVPVGVEGTIGTVDEHHYIENPTSEVQNLKSSNELFFLKIRYKDPDASSSQLMTFPVKDNDRSYTKAGGDFRFASAVAQAGQLLRVSKYAGEADWGNVLKLARSGRGEDPHGYRAEFIRLCEVARDLQE